MNWLKNKISRGYGIEQYGSLKFAAVGDFLRSLEVVSPDVIKWVESLPDPSKYVNVIRKNPTISLQELQQYQPQEKAKDPDKQWLASKGVREQFIDYFVDNDRIRVRFANIDEIEIFNIAISNNELTIFFSNGDYSTFIRT